MFQVVFIPIVDLQSTRGYKATREAEGIPASLISPPRGLTTTAGIVDAAVVLKEDGIHSLVEQHLRSKVL